MRRVLVSNGNSMEAVVGFEADAIVSDGSLPEAVGP
jgi:hypothetical protein